MTVSATIDTSGRVNTTYLADGKLVQLSGSFGEEELPSLRLALLMPLAEEHRDVVVDAGEITEVTDESVALLAAAAQWALDNGARFFLSRSAPALDEVLDQLDLVEALPRLSELGPRPEPRAALSLR